MMRSVSSFTPHFYEDVTQSMTQLQDSGASASMLSILSALYPDEWENPPSGSTWRSAASAASSAAAPTSATRAPTSRTVDSAVEQTAPRDLDAAVLRTTSNAASESPTPPPRTPPSTRAHHPLLITPEPTARVTGPMTHPAAVLVSARAAPLPHGPRHSPFPPLAGRTGRRHAKRSTIKNVMLDLSRLAPAGTGHDVKRARRRGRARSK